MSIVIATYGPKVGTCNICGTYGPLTEDHTPPKGCLKPTQVEVRHISSHLGSGPPTGKPRKSQNGVKYRTLCARCNNTLLGHRYDPHFIHFVNGVGHALTSSLYLTPVIQIPGKPQAILRSLLGHLAAQGVDRYRKGPFTDAIRDYILDESLPFPSGLSAFYWAYPHKPQVMVRDAAYLNISGGHEPFALWLLKFFPVAFMVTWGEPTGLMYEPQTFSPWRRMAYDTEVDIPLVLRPTAYPTGRRHRVIATSCCMGKRPSTPRPDYFANPSVEAWPNGKAPGPPHLERSWRSASASVLLPLWVVSTR